MKKKIVWCLILGVFLSVSLTSAYIFGVLYPNQIRQEKWQIAMQKYYDDKVASFELENESISPFDVDVAFLGDSLTDFYNLNAFYPQYTTANRGIGGDTTFGLEKRLKVSVYDIQPKVVCMLIGANNLDTMFENYESILIGLKENLPSTKIVLLSLTSMGKEWGRNNKKASFNNVKIKLLAQKYGFEFVDLFSPLFDLGKNEIKSEYTTDGGHFTQAGYQVITDTITPVLENLL